MNDPRTEKVTNFVGELLEVRKRYGLTPTEVQVNPTDEFLSKFATICGLKVVHSYQVPKGNVILL